MVNFTSMNHVSPPFPPVQCWVYDLNFRPTRQILAMQRLWSSIPSSHRTWGMLAIKPIVAVQHWTGGKGWRKIVHFPSRNDGNVRCNTTPSVLPLHIRTTPYPIAVSWFILFLFYFCVVSKFPDFFFLAIFWMPPCVYFNFLSPTFNLFVIFVSFQNSRILYYHLQIPTFFCVISLKIWEIINFTSRNATNIT